MTTHDRAMEIIQASLDSLTRAGLVDKDIQAQDETVLLGPGSLLDSIAFVTFVTELEERISKEAGKELFLVLNDIHEYNPESAYLTAGTVAGYLAKLSAGPA
jgi:acyl carrier protein